MLSAPTILYLSSRIVSAAGAFLAVVLFTRLAGSHEYGQYLLIFTWSSIIFGSATQWMIVAYFGVYKSKQIDEYVASLAQLLCLALALIAVGFFAVALLGFWEPKLLTAAFFMIFGLTTYFGAFDVTRTRLKAQSAAVSMILRSLLTAILGTLVLWQGMAAPVLAIAVAVAHVIAAVPSLLAIGRIRFSQSSRAASIHILKYGLPLLLSFGVASFGQSVDRLLLAHYIGIAALGAYGAAADIMRQCFAVVGEAIVYSLITSAKQHANDGNIEASTHNLRTAFNACVVTGTFGATFFIVFGDDLLRFVLAPEFHAQISNLITPLAIAFGVMTIGHYYFAQVIFFTHASYLVPMFSIILIVVSSGLSVFLIPAYGPLGAAIALLVSYLVSYIALIFISQRYYVMPIDFAGLGEVSMIVVTFVLGTWIIGALVPHTVYLQILKAAVFIALSGFVVHRYGLLRSISGASAGAANEHL